MPAATESATSSDGAASDRDYVVYTGATLIPFCVGSVALPLTLCRATSPATTTCPQTQTNTLSSGQRGGAKHKRVGKGGGQQETSRDEDNGDTVQDYCAGISRCTHVRYIYIRDGSVASQDLSYRRQLFLKADAVQLPALRQERQCAEVQSASLFYAVVDRVVFKLPNGFPERRREVTSPPFFIVDDTWAEHLVEVEVHFRSWLGMAPFTASHMVLLNQRVDVTPQLLSSTQGQCKPPSTVIFSPDEVERLAVGGLSSASATKRSRTADCDVVLHEEGAVAPGNLGSAIYSPDMVVIGECGLRERLADLVGAPVVAERRDAIRIFHPTLNVVRYLAGVRALPPPELLVAPRICLLPWYQQSVQSAPAPLAESRAEDGEQRRIREKRRRSSLNSDGSDDNVGVVGDPEVLPPWCFPFEVIIHACEPRRQSGAVDAMRAVVEELRKEQMELRESIEQNIAAATANAEELTSIIEGLKQRCVALEASWKH